MFTSNVISAILYSYLFDFVFAGTSRMLPFSIGGIDLFLITGHHLVFNDSNSRVISVPSRCACRNFLLTLPDCKAVATYFYMEKNEIRCRIAKSSVQLHQLKFKKYNLHQNFMTIIKDQLVTPFKFDTKGGYIYYEVLRNVYTNDYVRISSACATDGGRIPIIKTLRELEGLVEHIVPLCSAQYCKGTMIGLSRNTNPGDPWMWDDGTLFSDTEVSNKYNVRYPKLQQEGNRINLRIYNSTISFSAKISNNVRGICQINIFP